MGELIKKEPLKVVYLKVIAGVIATAFYCIFSFTNGYANWFPYPVPQWMEDYDFIREWGKEWKYDQSLVLVDVSLKIKVSDGDTNTSTSKASFAMQNLRYESELITPIQYKNDEYIGKVKIHTDSMSVKLLVQHEGCEDKLVTVPINWNTKLARKAKAEKVKCFKNVIEGLVNKK